MCQMPVKIASPIECCEPCWPCQWQGLGFRPGPQLKLAAEQGSGMCPSQTFRFSIPPLTPIAIVGYQGQGRGRVGTQPNRIPHMRRIPTSDMNPWMRYVRGLSLVMRSVEGLPSHKFWARICTRRTRGCSSVEYFKTNPLILILG
jgi:hypothetical protein